MNTTALAEVSQGLITYLPLGLPVGIGALFVWVVLRTESWHLLRRRIWQVTHGNGDITDPSIRAFVEAQTNLAAFRVFVGPAAGTLEEAHALMQWCDARNVNLGSLRMCGDHFDPSTRRVQASERYLKWVGRWWAVSAFLLLTVGFLSLQLTSFSQVLLSVKSSGQHFFASESMVRSAWPPLNGATLRAKDCSDVQSAAARVPFAPEDTQLMCELLVAPEFKDYVRNALSTQRQALVLLGGFFLVSVYFVAVFSVRCFSALNCVVVGSTPPCPLLRCRWTCATCDRP